MNNNTQPIENSGIVPLTSGQQMRQAREAKGLTIEAVAKNLFVNKQVITNLENDDYTQVAAPVYARGYIASYARLLQIPVEPLMEELNKFETNLRTSRYKIQTLQTMKNNKSNHEHQSNWLIYTIVVLLVTTGALWGYNHYKQRELLKPTEKETTITTADRVIPLNQTTSQPEEKVLPMGEAETAIGQSSDSKLQSAPGTTTTTISIPGVDTVSSPHLQQSPLPTGKNHPTANTGNKGR